MAHRIQFRVYYEDTDAGGIVYHARYLGFAERARTEALRELGISIGALTEKDNISFVVVGLTARYRRPAKLDDILEVATYLKQCGAVKILLVQDIYILRESEKIHSVQLELELATLSVDQLKPVELPFAYKTKLEQMLGDR